MNLGKCSFTKGMDMDPSSYKFRKKLIKFIKTFTKALFAVNDKSSLMEDIEFRGGGAGDGDGDYQDATPEPKLIVPTLQYQVTNELKNGSAAAGLGKKDKTDDKTASTKANESSNQRSTSSSFMVLLLIFVVSVLSLICVYTSFPQLEESERAHIGLPKSIEDAKVLGDILSRYRDKYYFQVLSAVFAIYIFLQTFAIPGSIFLSIICGFLFSYPIALLLICFCSATGASLCYALSFLVGRKIIYKYFPERADSWSKTVEKHRDNLLSYIIFLRVTPFLPNWFINITSPIINVPIIPFWIGTFIGVAPPSVLAVQAGTTLHKLTSSSDAVSWTSLIALAGLGFLVLLPAIFKNRLKSKFE